MRSSAYSRWKIQVIKGSMITKEKSTEGNIPVIAGGQTPAYYHNEANREGNIITVSASGAYAGFVNHFTMSIFASDCTTIKSKNESKLMTKFVYHIMKGRQEDIYKFQRGGGQPHVYPKDLIPMKIPLPHLEVQERIVEEIENYQNIIDGARKVIDSYKPSFKIDPEWNVVELGDVCDLLGGGTPLKEKKSFWENGSIKWISSKHINLDGQVIGYELITKEAVENSSTNVVPIGTTIAITRVSVGKVAYADDEYAINQDLTGIKSKDEKALDKTFLFYNIRNLGTVIERAAEGIGVRGVTRGFVAKLIIPLPPIKIQKQIVSNIEEEQALVNSNKKLIGLFEKKIADKIAEVWGE